MHLSPQAEFDEFAKDFRQLHNENLKFTGFDTFYFVKKKVDYLAQYEKNEPSHLLDLGCGDGYTAHFVHEQFPLWQINGIEVSGESIIECKQKNIPQASFQVYDGTTIPFDDNSFDVVFISCIFHHVPANEHEALLKEVQRVLKKGGRLYLFEHNPFNIGTRYLVKTCVFDANAKLLPASYFSNIFKKQQWIIDKRTYITFFPGWKWIKSFLSLEKYFSNIPLGGQYYFRIIKP